MRGARREGRRGRVIDEVAWFPPDGNRWRGRVEGSVGMGGVREPASWRRLELGRAGVGLLAVNPDGQSSLSSGSKLNSSSTVLAPIRAGLQTRVTCATCGRGTRMTRHRSAAVAVLFAVLLAWAVAGCGAPLRGASL